MLYVLAGSDSAKIRARMAALTKGCEVVRFGEGAEPFGAVPGYLGARGLFSKKTALVLDRPLEHSEGKMLFEDHGDAVQEADMPVVIIETALAAAQKKSLPKKTVCEEFDAKSPVAVQPLSAFALSDAFASGDRKKAWIVYRTLVQNGSSPEELHGILSWQARTLVVASKTSTAAEAGLKPFVYAKAKRAASKLTSEQTEEISRELVKLLHASRMGQGALEDLLEAFLLKKA